MRYYKMISEGYLLSVGTGGNTGEEILKAEYNTIMQTILNVPTAPDGFGYRLTESLEWELYELPVVEDADEEATAEDYQSALSEFGVSV